MKPSHPDIDALLHSGVLEFDAWSHVQKLTVPCQEGGKDQLEVYDRIIGRAPSLSRLIIKSTKPDPRDTHDITAKLLTIFEKKAGQGKMEFLSFSLDRTNLSQQISASFQQCFSLCKIQVLKISLCTHWKAFLNTLTAVFTEHGTDLHTLTLEIHRKNEEKGVIESFLGSSKGLRVFRYFDDGVGYEEDETSMDIHCLENHASTLEQLAIAPAGCSDSSHETGISDECFENIVLKCHRLRQLALIMPYASCCKARNEYDGYARKLRQLLNLPQLRVLRLLNWPQMQDPSFQTLPADLVSRVRNHHLEQELDKAFTEAVLRSRMSRYMQYLDKFVNDLVSSILQENWKSCSAPILCFSGPDGCNCVRDEQGGTVFPESICYVPVTQTDVFNRTEISMQRISMMEGRYLEPENELLSWMDDYDS